MRIIISALVIAAFSGPVEATPVKLVTVAQSGNEVMTNERADAVLTTIGQILVTTAHGGIACNGLTFKRRGEVKRMPFIPQFINTKAQLDALLNSTAASVFIVRGISYCDPNRPGIHFIGCARRGRSIAVVDYTHPSQQSINAVLWLHEFGHTQNLSWATENRTHSHNPNAVMFPSVSARNLAVTFDECAAFKAASARFPTALGRVAVAEADTRERGASDILVADLSNASEVVQLLSELWVEELPIDRIMVLTDQQMDEVRTILFDPSQEILWLNAVMALALNGRSQDIELLMRFLDASAGNSSRSAERAKLQVPIAIGALSAKHQRTDSVSFLARNVNPRALEAPITLDTDDEELQKQFAIQSLRGLAIAGADIPIAEESILQSQRANEVGQLDLGVGQDFFNDLEAMRAQVRANGFEAYLRGGREPQ